VSIFRRHRDGRLDVRQTAARSSSQYRRGRGLLIRELANGQPIMVAKGQGEALHCLRAQGEIGDEAFRRIQEELDWSELDAAPAGSFQSLAS